jgi:hypothetical protein
LATGHSIDSIDGEVVNAEWVTGKYGLAFHFSGDDTILVTKSGDTVLDASNVLMMAWIMPSQPDVMFEEGIVMSKESSYKLCLKDNTRRLQGAFSPGGWRW